MIKGTYCLYSKAETSKACMLLVGHTSDTT